MTFAAAKQYSLAVARDMMHKIPWEIRLHIYEQFMDVDQTVRSLKTPVIKHAHGEAADELTVAIPQFLQPEYPNAEIAKFILSPLYDACFFREEHVISVIMIKHFLTAAPIHSDYTPNLWISRLVIEWNTLSNPSYTSDITTASLKVLGKTKYDKRPIIIFRLKWFDIGQTEMFPTLSELEALRVACATLIENGHWAILIHNDVGVPDVDTLVQQWEVQKTQDAEDEAALKNSQIDAEEAEAVRKAAEGTQMTVAWRSAPDRNEAGGSRP